VLHAGHVFVPAVTAFPQFEHFTGLNLGRCHWYLS
jgi:hypothetical protein